MSDRCKQDGCGLRAYWIEYGADGSRVFCYRVRHDGRQHVQRFTLKELGRILKPPQDIVPARPGLQ
jgi:hypothetical protein